MTIHPLDFRSDIRISYTLEQGELDAFHVTLRPIVLELIAISDPTRRWSLLHQLRDALGKLYRHERLTDHGWHHQRQNDRRSRLERERWDALKSLDDLIEPQTGTHVDNHALYLFLASLAQSEQAKLALGRPLESIGSRHFG